MAYRKNTKAWFLDSLTRPGGDDGWHFQVGEYNCQGRVRYDLIKMGMIEIEGTKHNIGSKNGKLVPRTRITQKGLDWLASYEGSDEAKRDGEPRPGLYQRKPVIKQQHSVACPGCGTRLNAVADVVWVSLAVAKTP